MGDCIYCGKNAGLCNTVCDECRESGVSAGAHNRGGQPNPAAVAAAPVAPRLKMPEQPILASVLYCLAGLSLLGGFILALAASPPAYSTDYSASFLWFSAGVGECVLFAAIGRGIHYLDHLVFHAVKLREAYAETKSAA